MTGTDGSPAAPGRNGAMRLMPDGFGTFAGQPRDPRSVLRHRALLRDLTALRRRARQRRRAVLRQRALPRALVILRHRAP